MLGVVAAVILLVAVVAVRAYNRFVEQRQLIENSWANVDTELQRRHELVPNLVATVKGYAVHERTTLEAVIVARQQITATAGTATAPGGTPSAENALVRGLRQLLAVAEAYPELRADAHFLDLQHQLTTTENRIQAARRIFNGNVREFNRRIESFPSMLIARAAGFARAAYFELEELRAAEPPQVVASSDNRHSVG